MLSAEHKAAVRGLFRLLYKNALPVCGYLNKKSARLDRPLPCPGNSPQVKQASGTQADIGWL